MTPAPELPIPPWRLRGHKLPPLVFNLLPANVTAATPCQQWNDRVMAEYVKIVRRWPEPARADGGR